MAQLGDLSLEYRSGLFFGVFALVLSFLTGIISGISFPVILVRALFMVPIFILVGYGAMKVLKRYVPEMYEVFASTKIEEETETTEEVKDVSAMEPESEPSGDINAEVSEEGYQEKEGDNFDRLNTINDSSLDGSLSETDSSDVSSGQMGKHIVVDESQFESYEPSVMAEAVRTMMSKDKD